MDRRERFESTEEAIIAVLEGWQAGIWTALPGLIQSFDATAMTCTVQPAIQARLRDDAGNQSWVNLPLLVDVPVCFPGGGGFTMTFPVKKDDECLVVFSSRCIDAWWQSGGIGVQAELRMHELSDGFAFVGVRSKIKTLTGIDTAKTQLRSDDNTVHLELSSDTVTIQAPNVKLGNGGAMQKLLNDSFKTWAANHVHISASSGSPTSTPTVAPDASMETSVVQAQ